MVCLQMVNPKYIITAGCSFTQYPQNPKFSNWPGHLSNYLGCEHNSKFIGKMSADNSYIANITLYTLSSIDKNDYDKILLGVMWSGINRMSCFLQEEPDSYHRFEVEGNPVGYIDKKYYFMSPHWNDELSVIYYKHYYDEIGSIIMSIKNMLLVQNFCKINNIKYFFTEYSYDCVSRNILIKHPEVKFLYEQLDKSNFLPVTDMSDWIDNNTSLSYEPNDRHPTTEMSKQFTENVIIPHLKNMGYVE